MIRVETMCPRLLRCLPQPELLPPKLFKLHRQQRHKPLEGYTE
jgi:hypothetical protein